MELASRRHLVCKARSYKSSLMADARNVRDLAIATHRKRLRLEEVAVAIAPCPRVIEASEFITARGKTRNLRVLPTLVMNLVNIAVAFVVRVLGLHIENLGLVQELEVEAEHFLVLGIFRLVSL